MKKILKYTLSLLLGVVVAVALIFSALTITEWRPEPLQSIPFESRQPTPFGDTLKILSWNIGYGGLGAEMDFFYDGGSMVRASRERTVANIDSIKRFLRAHSDFDVILLQEVDSTSKRNFDIDLYSEICSAMPNFTPLYALNYLSPYVPIPPEEPIGRVRSGLLTLVRGVPISAVRHSLPTSFPWPVRLFNLKRGLLSVGLRTERGDTLYINNVHCSAFDDGSMRRREIDFIVEQMSAQGMAITAGDWNSVAPVVKGGPPTTPEFTPHTIQQGVLPADWHIACDTLHPTARFNNRPYNAATSLTTTIDWGLSTPNVVPTECRAVPLDFENSDHNPVVIRIVI